MKRINKHFFVCYLAASIALMGILESAFVMKVKAEVVQSDISWDGTVDVSWYADSKMEFDISTAEQLAGLAQIVNDGNTFQGKKINICQDIFLNDESYQHIWMPIAAYKRDDTSNLNVFQGTFCGNGHKIYNMRTSYNNNGGLFGRIGENGFVKCVDISQGRLNSGGCIANVNEGMISFCNNYSCTGGENLDAVGGICNVNSNLVYGCKNFGEVWGESAAGIVGLNKEGMSVVSQCSNHGLVGGSHDAAGLVNSNYGWLYNCYNRGTIADEYSENWNTAHAIAGIVYGNFGYGVVENCYSAGTFSYTEDEPPWMGIYGICREDNGKGVANCYALSANGKNNVSYEELADPSFIPKLDQQTHSVLSVWRADVNKINDGLPITEADESAYTGQYKIQPEAWILSGKKVIEVDLKDKKYHLKVSCYYNDSDPIVTIRDTDIAEISEDNTILFKKAGTTPINIHFNETENNSSADYQLTLKIEGTAENIAQTEVTSITCKKTVYKVAYGAKPFKINAASKGMLSFTSSNSKIATVDKNTGKVTIKGTGVATITVKAGKNSVKVTVKVNPKKQSLKSAKVAKGRKLSVKWAKDKNATGYQVQISTDRNFKKIAKYKNVPKNFYTFAKLKAGKKYYVRVRSYKKSGKETLYGAWSNVKRSGKVKK